MRRSGYTPIPNYYEIPDRAPTPELKEQRRKHFTDRMNKPKTSTACHGCGQSPGRYRGRPKDEVCDDCLILMWDGEDARIARQSAERGPNVELIRVGVPRRGSDHPDWPYWYVPHYAARAELNEFYLALADLVYRLLRPWLDQHSDRYAGRFVPKVPQGSGKYRDVLTYKALAPAGVGDAIDRLEVAGEAMVKQLYAEGQDRGRMLLSQLAAGEITVDQFQAGREVDRR